MLEGCAKINHKSLLGGLGAPGADFGRSWRLEEAPGASPGHPGDLPGAVPGQPGGARGRPGGTPEVISEAIFGVFWSSEFARTFSHSKNTNFHRISLNFRHAHPCGEQFGLAPRGVCSTSAFLPKNARVDSKNLEKPRKSFQNRPKIDENRSPGPSSGDFGREKSVEEGSIGRLVDQSRSKRARSGLPGRPRGRSWVDRASLRGCAPSGSPVPVT